MNKIKETLPWIEKYRPVKIKDICLPSVFRKKVQDIVERKDIPNIIITGRPGIGKTTTIKCIINDIMKDEKKEKMIELNASDDRGIKSVEELIKNFCKKSINKKNTTYKVILLDEADNMTKKAQLLINHLMEEYKNKTRFAFTCNESSEIIETIQSKCIILRYNKVDKVRAHKRLEYICNKENVEYEKEAIIKVIENSKKDMRNIINNLQIINNNYNKVDLIAVSEYFKINENKKLEDIIYCCNNNKLIESFKIIQILKENGYSSIDIILSLKNILVYENLNIKQDIKMKYIEIVCETTINMNKEIESNIQLTGCISKMCKIKEL